jgi:hypothetical protein
LLAVLRHEAARTCGSINSLGFAESSAMSINMRTAVCDLVGVEYPVFGFTHCREVVVAISRAGGMGMYGAAYFSPERVQQDVAWINERVEGRPFGVDVMIPSRSETTDAEDLDKMATELERRIPQTHRTFVEHLLERFGVPPVPEGAERVAVYPLGLGRSRSVGATGDAASAHPHHRRRTTDRSCPPR